MTRSASTLRCRVALAVLAATAFTGLAHAESEAVAGISSGDKMLAAPVMIGSLGQRIAMRTSDAVDVAMIVKEIAP